MHTSLPLLYFFFFLMIRRPPRSTLFPYTRSSDLLATSGYAEPLRRRLAQTTRIERAFPLPERVAQTFGAAVYPMALVAARADPSGTELTSTALGAKSAAPAVPQKRLQIDGPWILAPGVERI